MRTSRTLGIFIGLFTATILTAFLQGCTQFRALEEPLATGLPSTIASSLCKINYLKPTEARRLTSQEYINTVCDLFNDPSAAVGLTGLPEDHISAMGFDNDGNAQTTFSDQAEKYLNVATKIVEHLVTNKTALSCTSSQELNGKTCAKYLFDYYLKRAFRRPPSIEESERLLQFLGNSGNSVSDLKEAITAMLVSPQFIYIYADTEGKSAQSFFQYNGYEIANRLSYFIWRSMPDETLFKMAEEGKLSSDVEIWKKAESMLDDHRSEEFIKAFAGKWVGFSGVSKLTRDKTRYPDFDNIKADLEKESLEFLKYLIKENRPIEELLTADYSFINSKLAQFYKAEGNFTNEFSKTRMPAAFRKGILTQASVLTASAREANDTSPIVRGRNITKQILCQEPPPPPPGIAPLEDIDPSLSLRERMELHRNNPSCISCHKLMDPIGLAFENFDAIGQWRTTVQNHEVDASGQLDKYGSFSGPVELVELMSTHENYKSCVSSHLISYAINRELNHKRNPDDICIVKQANYMTQYYGNGFKDLIRAVISAQVFSWQSPPAE